jgi:hypothetical protein
MVRGDLRLEGKQCARKVRRGDRDAVAGLETVLTVIAKLRIAILAATQPASEIGMTEVPAADALAEVAPYGPHLAQLASAYVLRRLKKYAEPLAHDRVGCEIGHADAGPNAQGPVLMLEGVQTGAAQVDDHTRACDAALHLGE